MTLVEGFLPPGGPTPSVYPPLLPFSTALPLGGTWQVQPQAVVAPAGQPAFVFTAAPGVIPGGSCQVTLIANGISNPPIVPATWLLTSPAWNNAAGAVNTLTVWVDYAGAFSYAWAAGGFAATPTTFTATHGATSISIAFGGLALAAATPPLSAFSLSAVRPAQAGQPFAGPAPYALTGVTVTAGTGGTVTLTVSGGTFQTGDQVSLSYQVPFSDTTQGAAAVTPLQDGTSYVAPWSGATVTIT